MIHVQDRLVRLQPVRLALPLSLAFLTLFTSGCKSIQAAQEDSKNLIVELHKEINAADYNGIYANADPAFREGTSAADSELIFKGVHDKLGQANSSELQNTRWVVNTNGEFITSDFKSSFTRDAADEEVVWRKTDGGYHLYRYNINSKAFFR